MASVGSAPAHQVWGTLRSIGSSSTGSDSSASRKIHQRERDAKNVHFHGSATEESDTSSDWSTAEKDKSSRDKSSNQPLRQNASTADEAQVTSSTQPLRSSPASTQAAYPTGSHQAAFLSGNETSSPDTSNDADASAAVPIAKFQNAPQSSGEARDQNSGELFQVDETVNVDELRLHESGECKPCLYFGSRVGCRNGDPCRFCHLPHARKPRPCKSKRLQCKQIVGMLHDVFGEQTQEFQNASTRLSAESSYMRSILAKPDKKPERPGADEPQASASSSNPPQAPLAKRTPEEAAEIGTRFGDAALAILHQ